MNVNPIAWAASTLRLFTRIDNDGVNATVPVTEIKELPIGFANMDIALVAKGTGATLAQVPDGTIAGGNKRGTRSTDWQKSRTSTTQVASGTSSTIAGGVNNTASAAFSFVGGGDANTASGQPSVVVGGAGNTASGGDSCVLGGSFNTASSSYSFVGGGASNTAQTGTYSTVCGGSTNTASGQYSFVGGGFSIQSPGISSVACGGLRNTATANYSSIVGGQDNTTSGTVSFIGGGEQNTANASHSCVLGGRRGSARSIIGYQVFPACSIPIADVLGVTQSALLLLARQTTDATATVLTSNTSAAAATNQVTLPNNSAYYFRGSVIAGVTGAGDSKSWTFEGAIKRGASAGTTAIVGTVILNTIAQDAGASAWSIAITADTTLGCISVTVTGAAATTIRWVAKIETTEMTY